jgi:hypothetical protein
LKEVVMRRYMVLSVPATLILFAICTSGVKSAVEPAQTRPDDATLAAVDSLQHLIASNRLELSTSDTSDSKEFCFEYYQDFPPVNGATPCSILVLRDHKRVAMLIRTLKGDCQAYFSPHFMILVDHRHPGSFVKLTEGFPAATYRMWSKGSDAFVYAYTEESPRPRLPSHFVNLYKIC